MDENIYVKMSLFVLLICLVLSSVCIITLYHCLHSYRHKVQSIRKLVLLCVLCIVTIVIIGSLSDYIYPFERSVKFKKIATIDIPPENAFNPEYPHFWHAAYEQYGFFCSSLYFSTDEQYSYLGFKWPEMDFKHHTYIITYCQQLESLTYNVWETIDIPIRTGAKAGYAVLSEEIDPCKIYVYEIPKMRIENDLNFTTEYVRGKMREAGKIMYW